jgi:integrase
MRILKMIASSESTRVFHTLGEPTTVSASYHRYVLESGVVDLRFHDLRHEAISRMVLYKRQLSVFEIMKIVGHRSLEMLNRYANLRGDELAHKME